eukprot:6183047-Pleurochrysis_carterae.AAC.2
MHPLSRSERRARRDRLHPAQLARLCAQPHQLAVVLRHAGDTPGCVGDGDRIRRLEELVQGRLGHLLVRPCLVGRQRRLRGSRRLRQWIRIIRRDVVDNDR